MPVRFLTKAHIAQYGSYTEPPSPSQLARYFYFDQTDLNNINQRYTDHTRLGYATLLGTVRFLGTFVSDLAEVPPEVITHLALQLSIEDATVWQRYAGSKTQRRHTEEIKQQYGYLDFHQSPLPFGLLRRLYARAWLGPDPSWMQV